MVVNGDAVATAQKQLLVLMQTKGNADKALVLLIQSGVAEELVSPSSDLEKATALLRLGVYLERPPRARTHSKPAATKARDAKIAKEADKQWALVAAKVAQSVVKTYISGDASATSDEDDVIAALDVATLALSVTCQFESLVKLGDFVVDNMLYQVAKKLGEMPKLVSRSLRLFAALHVRLWHHHSIICATLNKKAHPKAPNPFATRVDELLTKRTTSALVVDDLRTLCIFPEPQNFHTLQFTRFLISLVNTAVNVLLAVGKNQVILEVTKQLEPWIAHLSRVPGVDAKLPASFSDRMFRVLWKCAAAIDSQKPTQKGCDPDVSLEYRTLALSYMLKCPNYSNGYFIQQVHRIGVQYEKKTHPNSDNDAGVPLHKFYTASANALLEQRMHPGKGFKDSTVEWDFIIWLEHFASICDLQPRANRSRTRVDALTIVHQAVNHLSSGETAHKVVAGCLLAFAGTIVFEQVYSIHSIAESISEKEVRHILSSDLFHSSLAPRDTALIISTMVEGRKDQDKQWTESLQHYLDGIKQACSAARETTSALPDSQLGIVLRLVRKVSTNLFGVLSSDPDEVIKCTLSSIVTSGDLLTALRKNEAIKLGEAMEGSFLTLEGRIRRLVVSVTAKLSTSTSEDEASTFVATLTDQFEAFQNVFNHAFADTGKQHPLMQSLFNDLQAIAREAYMCATFFYKKQQPEMVERSLVAAFQLVENYLEHVMCSELSAKSPDQIEAAHVSLKVDALASLLAFSCRQQSKLSLSRKYHGYSILYSSDPKGISSGSAIDKYAVAVIEEYQSLSGREPEKAVFDRVRALCESIESAWSARGADRETVMSAIRLLSDGFERNSIRLLDKLRVLTDTNNETPSEDKSAREMIEVCTKLEIAVWKILWARADDLSEPLAGAMESILQAISKRKIVFGDYFLNRDDSQATSGLWAAHDELTQAIACLTASNEPVGVDIGGCYGWRGVFTLEICQMQGYAGRLKENAQQPAGPTNSENKALEDIKKCLAYWREAGIVALKRPPTHVFDFRGISKCLDAICHALSLMSQIQLESEARALLSSIQVSTRHSSVGIDYEVGLPSTILQPSHVPLAGITASGHQERSQEEDSTGLLSLSLVDADIGLCLACINASDLVQARLHLAIAISGMKELRSSIKISSEDTHHYAAVAMRELALSMAESEVVFHEGNVTQAIRDAKAALSICWKISKKVGIVEPDRRFDLPVEVKHALGKHVDTAQKASLVCFQAIECWSWDILLAAKLILSRIAHLYVLSNQPFRSSVYYAEAMTLVSGVVPHVTRRRPFVDFAQLQILSGRTNHATAVHQLVALCSDIDGDQNDGDEVVDASVIIQNCEVQLQRGDLCLLEGGEKESRECYEAALRLLRTVDQRTPALSSISCGCYRRLLKLQLRVAITPWLENTVDQVIDSLKNLKKALKKCTDIVEHALSTCQLVQTSLALLRSSSSKAFLPLEKLSSLMHDVLTRCDHLGIAFVTHEIRFSMGLVCLMQSESLGAVRVKGLEVSYNWAAAGFLSSYHVIGTASDVRADAQNTSEIDRASTGFRSAVSGLSTRIQDVLPDAWLIVSITTSELSEFTISITPTNGHEPVSFWMGKIRWAEHAQELEDIIDTSRKTLFGNGSSGVEEWTAEKKKQWWSTRKELDDHLHILITKVQDALGFWRALLTFVPTIRPSPSLTAALNEIASLIYKKPHGLSERSTWLISATLAMGDRLSDIELLQCIDQVAIEENVSIRDEQGERIVKVFRTHKGATSNQATATILVLHPRLERFPWEGLDIMRNSSVTRMPSIELILQNAERSTTTTARRSSRDLRVNVDAGSVSYLLNPAGDLKATQDNLEPLFRRGEAELGWRGIVGDIPDEDWMRESLLKSSLFVFCGHGSGEKYFHRDKIAALRGRGCAAALLFGCSSGRLEREGVFGPNGAVISYLQAGSPAVLAMLWDVTDKDVDLMSKEILENWLLAGRDGQSIAREVLPMALQRSRRLCKLQYLNGLAAVCYGLPLRVATLTPDPVDSPGNKRRKLR